VQRLKRSDFHPILPDDSEVRLRGVRQDRANFGIGH
jgi:hypothetical protein